MVICGSRREQVHLIGRGPSRVYSFMAGKIPIGYKGDLRRGTDIYIFFSRGIPAGVDASNDVQEINSVQTVIWGAFLRTASSM